MNIDASTYQSAASQAGRLSEMIIDSLDVGVIALDQSANITFINMQAKQQIPRVCLARHLSDYLRPVDLITSWASIISAIDNSTQISLVECETVGTDQIPNKIIDVKCMPLRGASGEIIGVIISLLGVRPFEDSPTNQQEILQRLASLGRLTSQVAHELNNPLDGILRYTNLALRLVDANDNAKLSTYLHESRTGIKRMVQIISDLLEYSRTAAKGFDLSNINEIVEQAAKSVSELVDDRRLLISLNLHHENMPSISGSRLYQVCCNLMKNALDAMPAGGQLVVSTNIESGHVVIRFADTGTGLPDGVQDIFRPFVTTKTLGSGTGLGLAICKDFIEDMNGTITAEPNQPVGAIFTTRVPLASCVASQGAKGAI